MLLLRPNPSSGVPIYLQLMEQVKHAIDTGVLRPGEQLPGIRPLAEELVINPNTVAKAYRELEHEGVIELRQGAGAFVPAHARAKKLTDRVRAGQAIVAAAVERLQSRGITDAEIRRLFEAELAGLRKVEDTVADPFVIETVELRKAYDGVEALRGLNLQVPAGSIFGFLGRNGAGKTTAMKVLLGMARPTSGTRASSGCVRSPDDGVDIRRRAAFVSEDKGLYDAMNVDAMIRFTALVFSAVARRPRTALSADVRAAAEPAGHDALPRHADQARVAPRPVPRRGTADPRRTHLRA